MQYRTIILEKRDGIAILTLNRPETLNAFNAEMVREAAHAIHEIDKDEDTRVLIVTGAGRGFSSGADVRQELAAVSEGATPTLSERDLIDLFVPLRKIDKPVIAAINGIAVGAGLCVALACDLRIASDKAQFAMTFILRGIMPDCGGTFFVPKLVGSARACELIFTGDIIDAQEAYRIGLVNKVVPHEELMKATEELASRMSRRPPIALKYAKRAIYKGLAEVDLASHLDYEFCLNRLCAGTEDAKEGIRAFLEKREPTFRGK